MAEWNDFFVASAGAAAALTGLIFVGLSINLKEILKHKSLPSRASMALLLLMGILLSSITMTTPLQRSVAGILSFVMGLGLWIILTVKGINIYKNTPAQYKKSFLANMLLDQVAALPYLFAGVLLIMNVDAGFYFILAAYLFSFSKAVLDAWVLIIEILR